MEKKIKKGKIQKIQETRIHAILPFPAECGPIWRSFPVWGSFAVGDLRRSTDLKYALKYLQTNRVFINGKH